MEAVYDDGGENRWEAGESTTTERKCGRLVNALHLVKQSRAHEVRNINIKGLAECNRAGSGTTLECRQC